MFPIFGALAAAVTAAQAVSNVTSAQGAPKPMSQQDVRKRYDSRIKQGTDAARGAATNETLSLARSGSGTGGGRASSLRAAMMQAPASQAYAAQAGMQGGASVADSEIGSGQRAHVQQTDRYWTPIEHATRASGAAAKGFSDMETQNMQLSDEHSKTEIRRLTDENSALRAAMEHAGAMTAKRAEVDDTGEDYNFLPMMQRQDRLQKELDDAEVYGGQDQAPLVAAMQAPPGATAAAGLQRPAYAGVPDDPSIPDIDVMQQSDVPAPKPAVKKAKKTVPPQGRQKKVSK